ncbi:MAG: hypothetical protein K2Y14_12935 [Burkholderiales bacterium]|nr:hypothetical protein [Burkholderiales bacterium]
MREKVNMKDLLKILGITGQRFHALKFAGHIPPADDIERKPFMWNVDNNDLVKFIESRNKLAQFTQFINS